MATESDVSKAKSAAMAIGLALVFGGCAGRSIGYAEGRDDGTMEGYQKAAYDVRSGKLQVRRFEIPRRPYASDAAWREAVRQAEVERR